MEDKKVQMYVAALAAQGIQITIPVLEQVLLTVQSINDLGGDFKLSDAIAIQEKIAAKYPPAPPTQGTPQG